MSKLSNVNRLQIRVPAKFGNAFLVMSEVAVFHYKQMTYYDRPGQFTIRWNDPACIFWGCPGLCEIELSPKIGDGLTFQAAAVAV